MASYSSLDLSHCIFVGTTKFNQTEADIMIKEVRSITTSPMFFTGSNIEISSYANTYRYFAGSLRGGVFSFQGVSFTETMSIYEYNSAILGGVVSCSNCSLNTEGNEYNHNYAFDGGVLYIESDSTLIS